jgi:hypothetical protein
MYEFPRQMKQSGFKQSSIFKCHAAKAMLLNLQTLADCMQEVWMSLS